MYHFYFAALAMTLVKNNFLCALCVSVVKSF